MDFSDLFSSLGSDATSLASTGTSLLPLASGINGLVNGTPAASAASTPAASSASSWMIYAVLGGIGLIAVILFLGKK
jgi:hypothetical protein